jgi:hypothetical protein
VNQVLENLNDHELALMRDVAAVGSLAVTSPGSAQSQMAGNRCRAFRSARLSGHLILCRCAEVMAIPCAPFREVVVPKAQNVQIRAAELEIS